MAGKSKGFEVGGDVWYATGYGIARGKVVSVKDYGGARVAVEIGNPATNETTLVWSEFASVTLRGALALARWMYATWHNEVERLAEMQLAEAGDGRGQ